MTHSSSAAVEALDAVLRGRRSIDLYEAEPAPLGKLLAAIDMARWAPNHRLTEPWHFYLIGPATRAALIDLAVTHERNVKGERAAEARRTRLGAIPGFFVLTSLRSEDALLDHENYAACCCAAQNLMLHLWAEGIGVKWTTGAVTRLPEFAERLSIDVSNESIVGFFWYGVPRVVPEQKRRPVADVVTELD
jgi:nitroreductase